MEEDVKVDETTEESQPEENTEETEVSEEVQAEDEASEETETTTEAEADKPKPSRASERIRELIAQKKELEARVRQNDELEGVDENGIDPTRFAESLGRRSSQTAQQVANDTVEYKLAERDFPLVKDNAMVRSRAAVLVDEGYSPLNAAEMATLEWTEQTGSVSRKSAANTMKQNASIPKAGKVSKSNKSGFTREEIAKMSATEYQKHAAEIQAQLEKYGAESFN